MFTVFVPEKVHKAAAEKEPAQDPTGLVPVGVGTAQFLIQLGSISGLGTVLPSSCDLSFNATLGSLCTAGALVLADTQLGVIAAQFDTTPTAGATTLDFDLTLTGYGVVEISPTAICPAGYGPFGSRPMSDLVVEDMRAVWDPVVEACRVEVAMANQGGTGWDGNPTETSPSFYATEGSSAAYVAVADDDIERGSPRPVGTVESLTHVLGRGQLEQRQIHGVR